MNIPDSTKKYDICINGIDVPVWTGFMPIYGFKTFFRIVGKANSKNPPIVMLHGGPGGSHCTLEVLDCLSLMCDCQIIQYDQLGCGESFVEANEHLWKSETWVNELNALLDYLNITSCHLLGQSWGGMLLIAYLVDHQPKNVISGIISSGLCSSQLWGRETHKLVAKLPDWAKNAIANAESDGDYLGEEYLKANELFYQKFVCDSEYPDGPECFNINNSNSIVYETAWGPNEYTPLGTLKNFEYTDKLHSIKQPCLIINGSRDVCTPVMAKTMADRIPNSKWELFEGCRHRVYYEGGKRYLDLVSRWVKDHNDLNTTTSECGATTTTNSDMPTKQTNSDNTNTNTSTDKNQKIMNRGF